MQRTTEKQVRFFEFCLASSFCIPWHRVSSTAFKKNILFTKNVQNQDKTRQDDALVAMVSKAKRSNCANAWCNCGSWRSQQLSQDRPLSVDVAGETAEQCASRRRFWASASAQAVSPQLIEKIKKMRQAVAALARAAPLTVFGLAAANNTDDGIEGLPWRGK